MKDNERLRQNPGFAVVVRFNYSGERINRRVQSVDQFELTPGEGLLFIGEGDLPETPVPITKATLAEELRAIHPTRQLQLIAFVDEQSGGLLFSDGTPERSFGITRDIPVKQRFLSVNFGNTTFAGIWGESRQEAYACLNRLRQEKIKRIASNN